MRHPTSFSGLRETVRETREALNEAPFNDLSIIGAGRAALDLLSRDPETCMQLAYQQLHAVPYKEVKTCWLRLYTDAALWMVLAVINKFDDQERNDDDDWMAPVVKMLDMALILTGAAGREALVDTWFEALEEAAALMRPNSMEAEERKARGKETQEAEEDERPAKRSKLSHDEVDALSDCFPDTISNRPTLRYPICRARNLSHLSFQNKVANPAMQTPLIIEGSIEHWTAFGPATAWKNPSYLMRKTLNGRRLIPVEVGRSYTDEGWGQKILTFKDFMERYMLKKPSPATDGDATTDALDPAEVKQQEEAKGYLAQHDLFVQIPALRENITVPDYCFTSPAPQPENPANVKAVEKLEEPLMNAWFGPAGTISPLHTDPYHNILAQVVGYKYVRLYAPEETPKMYPRGTEGNGIDMSNTSQVGLSEAMAVWPEISCWGPAGGADAVGAESKGGGDKDDIAERFPLFAGAKYSEGVLGPGECLYIPRGWWHYVQSLTTSFSVSFWWN
ncbi:hypothetical protein GRF29_44g2126334 [Pseudopithomyces chartarum]|uniref:JmjC domain-containing protein n=1 Tax=Pseudopithomyces chartarum TaxID=1892770 RepID=A0AAN6LZX9_9PLEO|nr:hypothetical protein GRF29_44g2126334 [Pseudopithomyces chartarum]